MGCIRAEKCTPIGRNWRCRRRVPRWPSPEKDKAIMEDITDYRQHVGSSTTKFYKSTLFESPRLLLGLNCLEPGQTQAAHEHSDQDKFYFVVEGHGEFTVGDE